MLDGEALQLPPTAAANGLRAAGVLPAIAQVLRQHLGHVRPVPERPTDPPLFANAWGRPLTRFGVRYLLRKHVTAASHTAVSLRKKRIRPHSIRH